MKVGAEVGVAEAEAAETKGIKIEKEKRIERSLKHLKRAKRELRKDIRLRSKLDIYFSYWEASKANSVKSSSNPSFSVSQGKPPRGAFGSNANYIDDSSDSSSEGIGRYVVDEGFAIPSSNRGLPNKFLGDQAPEDMLEGNLTKLNL